MTPPEYHLKNKTQTKLNMEISKEDHFKLSTGKEFYAHGNILGLCDDVGSIYTGYDGGEDVKKFTKEEQIEIAEYMIDMWTKVKNG